MRLAVPRGTKGCRGYTSHALGSCRAEPVGAWIDPPGDRFARPQRARAGRLRRSDHRSDRPARSPDGLRYWCEEVHRTRFAVLWKRRYRQNELPLLWTARWCAADVAFYLAYVARCEEPPHVLDVSGLRVRSGSGRPYSITAVGTLPSQAIVGLDLLAQARRLSHEEHLSAKTRWLELQAENAELRILDESGLRSAPVSHHDHLIVDNVCMEWRRGDHVVADATNRIDTSYWMCNPAFIWARIRSLVADGRFEARGDLDSWRDCWLRRPWRR